MLIGISILTKHTIISTTPFSEHTSQILHNSIWTLPSCKMTTTLILAFIHNRPQGMIPKLGQQNQVLGEPRNAKRHIYINLTSRKHRRVPMLILKEDILRSRRTRIREIVNAYPRKYLVRFPGIVVCPIMKLFVDPSQQADGAVIHAVADGLRLCRLLSVVTVPFLVKPSATCQACHLGFTQRRSLDLCVKVWESCFCRLCGRGVADMVRFAMFVAILQGQESSNCVAYVSSLNDWRFVRYVPPGQLQTHHIHHSQAFASGCDTPQHAGRHGKTSIRCQTYLNIPFKQLTFLLADENPKSIKLGATT